MPITLKLVTHSPVHIGSGRKLETFEYLIHDGYLWRLHPDRLAAFLLDEAGDAALDQLADWITGEADRLKQARGNQEQSRIRQSLTFQTFLRRVLGRPDLNQRLLARLPEVAHYRMPTPHRHFRQLIREQLKQPNGQLYLPGSSVKGALRTCLLYQVLTEADEATIDRWHRRFNEELQTLKEKGGTLPSFFARWLEQEVFFCGVKRENDRVRWGDAQYDLLKFLMVSDSTPVSAEKGVVLNVALYLPGSRPQPQAPPVEALGPGVLLETRIGFEVSFLQAAWAYYQQKRQGVGEHIWIGLPERFTRLYGFSLEETHALASEALERRLLERVRTAVQNFSQALRAFEIRWCEQAECGETRILARQLVRFYRQLPNDTLRLGWGSGFAALTVFLALRDELAWEEALGELLALRFGLSGNNSSSVTTFPRSRRLTPQEGGVPPVLPFGWVELRWPGSHQPAPEEAAATAQPATAELIAWKEQIGPRSRDILAEVVDNTRAPFLIRVFVQGLENETFPCGGARPQNLQIGQRLRVEVADWDKKQRRPRMFRVQSLRV
ncbi:type III-A CRISPR-associated RAMP protein Csm5 [Rhodothermus profundi]|uniref:CRISPR system Cms protein Csm5 n=1 Tax=Rhodothermus profundi TaxID=633813 RepID=A0A1M6SLE7_9BACT|nr:type III-A CRISPR-associated RAMP protein Csm5 [Rhodothermus profundi]SHK45571.1 CRISPR-associated protein Csm5 [Rhodothermus profundi]